jgi:hypothetical protein
MMVEDAAPLVEALLTIVDAARAYLPPGRVQSLGCLRRLDNPRIIAALAAHGEAGRPSARKLWGPAVLAVPDLAMVINAEGPRFRAVGEQIPHRSISLAML